jgi:hypothetical protein
VAAMKRLIYILTFLSCFALSWVLTPQRKARIVIPASFTHEVKCPADTSKPCVTIETIQPPREIEQ